MALAVSMILTGIAIICLVIYGADAMVGQGESGFLPMDEKTRGVVLGMPSVILPFIAFGISVKEPSKGLAGLLFACGALLLMGGAAMGHFTAQKATEIESSGPGMDIMLYGIGAIIIILGIIKIKKSSK
tara:strand:- start:602 stop:988 length:387 start_codon:yes stop_codon:yes gene_type:complete